jgi:hypothetical protein
MTAADWTAQNPTLPQFVWGYEKDTGKIKAGPGAWNDLGYLNPSGAAAAADITAAVNAAVNAAVTALLDGAPGALNTLNELAAALGDDAAFATTVTNALAGLRGGPPNSVADQTARLALTGLSQNAEVYQVDTRETFKLVDPTHPELLVSWQAVLSAPSIVTATFDFNVGDPQVLVLAVPAGKVRVFTFLALRGDGSDLAGVDSDVMVTLGAHLIGSISNANSIANIGEAFQHVAVHLSGALSAAQTSIWQGVAGDELTATYGGASLPGTTAKIDIIYYDRDA